MRFTGGAGVMQRPSPPCFLAALFSARPSSSSSSDLSASICQHPSRPLPPTAAAALRGCEPDVQSGINQSRRVKRAARTEGREADREREPKIKEHPPAKSQISD